jgi:hypothetical protein
MFGSGTPLAWRSFFLFIRFLRHIVAVQIHRPAVNTTDCRGASTAKIVTTKLNHSILVALP